MGLLTQVECLREGGREGGREGWRETERERERGGGGGEGERERERERDRKRETEKENDTKNWLLNSFSRYQFIVAYMCVSGGSIDMETM